MAGPLSHIRVLDLSRVLAGPWAGQNLADLGAEVIKVERPGSGDDSRAFGPPWVKDRDGRDTEDSAYYTSANRGKKSITVDISKPEGQKLVRELARISDVLIENYKFGDLARYRLAYDDLAKINPRLVYCSVTGFGQTGPYRERPGYDFMIQGMGGMMSVTGEPDDAPGGGPQRAGVPVADIITGMYASIARASRSAALSLPCCPPRRAAVSLRAKSSNARSDFVGRAAFSMRAMSPSVSGTFRVRAYATTTTESLVSSSLSGMVTGSSARTSGTALAFSSTSRGRTV